MGSNGLRIVLHTRLLYQQANTRNTNVLAVLKQYSVVLHNEQWDDLPEDLPVQLAIVILCLLIVPCPQTLV